ncbi:MAG TPA: adenylate/guanylate cyclase domain-containing protein, partial [Verrucomicrobiae bacterium]
MKFNQEQVEALLRRHRQLDSFLDATLSADDRQPRRRPSLLTLLFTDMVSFTQLKQKLGDALAAELFQKHHGLLRQILAQSEGAQEIETAGDSFFIVFGWPSEAVKFALRLQAAIEALVREVGQPLADRIGIHAGEVLVEKPRDTLLDLFGLQVDTCARVMSLAGANQILMTRFVFDNARQMLKGQDITAVGNLTWTNHGYYELKGVEEPIEICEVTRGSSPATPPASSDKAKPHKSGLAKNEQDGPPPTTLSPIIPDYQLLRRVGQGGFGEVWLAKNVMGSFRAIKIVCRKTFENDGPFEREFDGIRKFEAVSGTHPGLLNVLHVSRNDAAGYFYYVMEVADDEVFGQSFDPHSYKPKTLSSEIARRGRLPLQECVKLGLSLAASLQHLHRAGLIHRDIKPANIIFVKGVPKLADIGLVTEIGAESIRGTLDYMPPEGPGKPSGDVFSLGKVLYTMSTGLSVEAFPELPGSFGEREIEQGFLEFNKILVQACEHDVQKRYPSAQALHDDLALLQRGKPIVSESPARPETPTSRPTRPRNLAIAAGVLLLGLAGAWGLFHALKEKQPAAGVVLNLVFSGNPPAAPAEFPKPKLELDLFAKRQGELRFRPLPEGDTLR